MRIRTGAQLIMGMVMAGALFLPPRVMAQATTSSWNSAANGGWEGGVNWSKGTPLAGTNVFLNASGSYAVTYSNPVSYAIGSLTITNTVGNTTTLNINTNGFRFNGATWSWASVVVNPGAVVTNLNAIGTGTNQTLTINGGTFAEGGAVATGSGPWNTLVLNVYGGLFDYYGSSGSFSPSLNMTGGVVRMASGAFPGLNNSVISGGVFSNLNVNPLTPRNASTITLTNQGQIVTSGLVVGGGTGGETFRVDGGTLEITSNRFEIGYSTFTGTRNSTMTQTAGTVGMTNAAGLVIGATGVVGNTSIYEYQLKGGTLNVAKVTLGAATDLATNVNALTVSGGILNLGAGGIVTSAAAATNRVWLSGGTLGAQASWSSALNMLLTNGPGPGTVTFRASDTNGVAQDIALSGNLTGNGGMVKTGAGTLSLGGNSSYSGTTAVSNGTLRVNGTLSGTGLLTVASNATLGGTGSVRSVNLSDGGLLAPGNSIGTLTVSNLTLNPGSLFAFELAATTASDKVVDLGTLTLAQLGFGNFAFSTNAGFGTGTYVLVDAALHGGGFATVSNESFYGYLGTISLGGVDGNDLVLNVALAIPEPSVAALAVAGLLLFPLARWRRARNG